MTKPRVESVTNQYLDRLLDKLKLPSDYALAGVLGVSPQAIYKMRGGGMMGAATAAKVAHLLKLDPLRVIAETELERGSQDEFWHSVVRKVAVVVLAIGASGGPTPPSAGAVTQCCAAPESMCIMLNGLRRRFRLWMQLLAGQLRGAVPA